MAVHLPVFSRACGECTKCCEGWLVGNVYDHRMFRGRHCHFLETACMIYEERPENPCKSYNCAWLTEETFPAWMKPSLSNVIITKRSTLVPTSDGMKKIDYYDAVEAGCKIDSSVLNWLIHWALDKGVNLSYEVDGKIHAVGEWQFKRLLNS